MLLTNRPPADAQAAALAAATVSHPALNRRAAVAKASSSALLVRDDTDSQEDDEEETVPVALEKAEIDRVDGVLGPANGTTFLITKALAAVSRPLAVVAPVSTGAGDPRTVTTAPQRPASPYFLPAPKSVGAG